MRLISIPASHESNTALKCKKCNHSLSFVDSDEIRPPYASFSLMSGGLRASSKHYGWAKGFKVLNAIICPDHHCSSFLWKEEERGGASKLHELPWNVTSPITNLFSWYLLHSKSVTWGKYIYSESMAFFVIFSAVLESGHSPVLFESPETIHWLFGPAHRIRDPAIHGCTSNEKDYGD